MFSRGSLTRICNGFKPTQILRRCLSSNTTNFETLNIQDTGKGYSILEMKHKPVNSFNRRFVIELNSAIKMLENDVDCRGVIVTSNLRVFSAGMDLYEMYEADLDHMRDLWIRMQNLQLNLMKSSLVLISAINGACPAGGCFIAFNCDYRVLANGNHMIGLNEAQIGHNPPYWLLHLMRNLIGQRKTEYAASLGWMMKPHEALAVGIVDDVVQPEHLMQRSQEEMEKWLRIPDVGRIRTKELIRKDLIDQFKSRKAKDLEDFLKGLSNPGVKTFLKAYIEKLEERKMLNLGKKQQDKKVLLG